MLVLLILTSAFFKKKFFVTSSPYVALLALKRLVEENPTNASHLTLQAIKSNSYMDDIWLASDSLRNYC